MSTLELYKHQWTCDADPKANILLVHGLGEHCRRYDHVAKIFNQADLNLFSMDLPGHGQSEGQRGHIDSFEDYLDVVRARYNEIRADYPETPIFLLGHSMGGLIAASMLLDHEDLFAGGILSAPAIQSPQEPPAWQVSIMKGIGSIFPKAKMMQLDADGVSRDPEVVKAYMADPLVSREKLTAQFLLSMTTFMQDAQDRAANITIPMLIMHGTGDVMTAENGSRVLHEGISSDDKSLNIYEGLYHELFNEPEGPEIVQEVADWIKARV